MIRHLALVHEKKNPFKCDIWNYSCFQKCETEKHQELVHEKKKPYYIIFAIPTVL